MQNQITIPKPKRKYVRKATKDADLRRSIEAELEQQFEIRLEALKEQHAKDLIEYEKKVRLQVFEDVEADRLANEELLREEIEMKVHQSLQSANELESFVASLQRAGIAYKITPGPELTLVRIGDIYSYAIWTFMNDGLLKSQYQYESEE